MEKKKIQIPLIGNRNMELSPNMEISYSNSYQTGNGDTNQNRDHFLELKSIWHQYILHVIQATS
jgi:hypothetical protein